MDAELREYVEVLRAGQERLEARLVGLEVRIDGLDKKLDAQTQRLNEKTDAQTQMLQADMQEMEKRLVESIRNRQIDEDIAFKEIAALKRKTRNLERRVEALEARNG